MSLSYWKDTLDNGLRVVTIEAPHLHSALVAAYVRTGSRHERPENNGVSHFLEHMFFRGSAGYPDTVRMNAAVEEVGGNLNGITMRDQSYYYTPVHPGGLGVAVSVLGDMLTRPTLRELELEREIILEEMLDEVDERGRDIDVENLSKREVFGEHPLGLKIAGTPKTVRSLEVEDLRAHLRRHYVASNLVLTAAGPIEAARFVDVVARAFEGLPAGTAPGERPPPKSPRGPRLAFVRHDEAQTELRITFRTVPEQHPDSLALQLVRRILDDGLSSRLPFNVVERRGLAYALHANIEAFHDAGLFDVEVASAPEKTPAVVEEVLRTLAELCDGGPTEEELARAKKRHRMFLDFSEDSPGELVGWFGGTELFHAPESFEERSRRIEAQTREGVQAVARRYFRARNLSVVAVGQRRRLAALERAVSSSPLAP